MTNAGGVSALPATYTRGHGNERVVCRGVGSRDEAFGSCVDRSSFKVRDNAASSNAQSDPGGDVDAVAQMSVRDVCRSLPGGDPREGERRGHDPGSEPGTEGSVGDERHSCRRGALRRCGIEVQIHET